MDVVVSRPPFLKFLGSPEYSIDLGTLSLTLKAGRPSATKDDEAIIQSVLDEILFSSKAVNGTAAGGGAGGAKSPKRKRKSRRVNRKRSSRRRAH